MRGSIKIFRLWGIPVFLHWSFGLIFLYAIWIGYDNGLNLSGTACLVGFFAAMFGCVLLHEYGHSLTARRYGVETQDIVLTPIGGIARLMRMPEKPAQEFWVAIAGPLVNVAIALLLGLGSYLFLSADNWSFFKWIFGEQFSWASSVDTEEVIEDLDINPNDVIFYLPLLVAANIWLVLFNLLPAFPMDGGRIFRALLAMKIGRVKATQIAAWLGQAVAVGFIFWGFYYGPITMALIGFFVFTTARSENAMVRLEDFMKRYTAKDLIRSEYTKLSENDWMQTPIELLKKGLERHFLVFNMKDELVGVLEEWNIMEAIKKRDLSQEIKHYVEEVQMIHGDVSLQYVHHAIRQKGRGIVVVSDHSGIIGVIDEAGLNNFMRLNGLNM